MASLPKIYGWIKFLGSNVIWPGIIESEFILTITEIFNLVWIALTQGTLPLLGYWTYVFIAMLVAIEGPGTTLFAALLASTGVLDPVAVFIAASLGNLSADIGWYLLGYLGRFEVLTQHIGWLRQHQARIVRTEQKMKEHAIKILLLAKLSLSMSVPALIAAGMARVRWRRWFPTIFLGECIWTGSLVFIGYHLGAYIKQFEKGIEVIAVAGVVIFGGLLIWLVKKLGRSSQFDPT
jgi:membrane protein DedA with SNARE-associated domain